MSEYNIQMNKYNALNAGYDQLFPATKIKNVDGLNTALQNNDPRRWGIGGVSKELTSSDDLNTIFENGLYRWGSSVPQNAPTEWPTSYHSYCMMRVWCYGVGDAIQEISSLNYDFKYTMKRICRNNVWTIEWDNPPMELGKEYRTTERYLGKPVYVKTIQADFLAAGNVNTTTDEEAKATGIVRFSAERNGWALPSLMYGGDFEDAGNIQIEVHAIGSKIEVLTCSKSRDMTSSPVNVTVYFTKD